MASLEGIRSKLDTKVFGKLGTTALVSSQASASIDKWGDGDITYATGVSAACVPYDYITDRRNYQPFGTLSENDVVFVFRYDTALDLNYKIVYDSTDYLIVEIEDYPYSGGTIALLVRCAKVL